MPIDFTIALPIIIFQTIFAVYCLLIIAKNPVRYLPKWAWAILCLNALGCIAFLILGRKDE